MTPRYSLVVPVYNEAGNIEPLVADSAAVLDRLSQPYEIILVNDGSTDATAAEIAAASRRTPLCREIRLPQRSGQAVALLAGLRSAAGGTPPPQGGGGPEKTEGFFPPLSVGGNGAPR